MLALKDTEEMLEYDYKVCEVSNCEDEATDIYNSYDMAIDVCDYHYSDMFKLGL